MHLDVFTLLVVLIGVCLMLGMALLLRWLRSPESRYLLDWSVALLLGAAAFVLLYVRGIAPDWLTIAVANALVLAAIGTCWNGFRAFNQRSSFLAAVVAGPVLWLIACCFPDFYGSFALRTALVWSLVGLCCAALADEIGIRGTDRLPARRPIAVICLAGAIVCGFRVGFALTHRHDGAMSMTDAWTAVVLLVTIFVIFGVALLSLGMTQQRTEHVLRRQASVDGLTGLLNRGAFVAAASTQIEIAARSGADIALLLFDLDKFKQINDSHGHAAGDAVLVAFAAILRHALRETDAIGRIGGEEFAALLTGVDGRRGGLVAEEIRGNFARRQVRFEGVTIGATVSIGLTVAKASGTDLTEMMARSDRALYAAKRGGRDLVRQES